MFSRGQGTIEYLVIIAIVVVISLVTAGFATGFFSSGSSAVRVSQDVGGKIGSGGISVLEGVSDPDGDVVLRLKNSTGEGFSVSRISGLSGGVSVVDKVFNDVFVPGGGDVSFSLDSLSDSCVCSLGDSRRICEFEITLNSSNGLEKKQRVSKIVDCVANTISSVSVNDPVVAPTVILMHPVDEQTIFYSDYDFNFYVNSSVPISVCYILIDSVVKDQVTDIDNSGYNIYSNPENILELEMFNYYYWDVNCVNSKGMSAASGSLIGFMFEPEGPT